MLECVNLMMEEKPKRGGIRFLAYGVLAAGAAVGIYISAKGGVKKAFASSEVYGVEYAKPAGWNEGVPGPFTLFVFRHPEGKGTIRGSINEVHANVNPTPELDTNGIADHFVDITKSNMPQWKALRLDDINGRQERFSLIRRSRDDRTIYTAYCTKGNTTVVVSLSGIGKAAKTVDDALPDFRKLVASFRLVPKNLRFED